MSPPALYWAGAIVSPPALYWAGAVMSPPRALLGRSCHVTTRALLGRSYHVISRQRQWHEHYGLMHLIDTLLGQYISMCNIDGLII
jgi:hypothetical protein